MQSLSLESLCTQINKLEFCIDAIVPTSLEYSEKQVEYFNNPAEHEEDFAEHLQSYPDQTLSMFRHKKTSFDEISQHYVAHLQKWFELMYVYCVANIMFNQSCDIMHAIISFREQNILLSLIEIRPCAQMLGLINLVIGQLLKICQKCHKNLLIMQPVPETLSAVQSMIQGNLSSGDYVIPLSTFSQMSNNDILTTCRLREKRARGFIDDKVIWINPIFLPSVEDINSQEAVDRRVDEAIQKRYRE